MGGASRLLAPLVVVALASGCRAGEIPGIGRDSLGRPVAPDEGEHLWRWLVETHVDEGSVAGGTSLPAGLVVAVDRAPEARGRAATHATTEDRVAAVPLGEAVFDGRTWRSASTADPAWVGARVDVEWLLLLRSAGACAARVEAVPRLVREDGCVARLDELRVSRVVALDEALVIGVDPARAVSAAGRALVGGGSRLVIRVKR
jgi:hypothetical protein